MFARLSLSWVLTLVYPPLSVPAALFRPSATCRPARRGQVDALRVPGGEHDVAPRFRPREAARGVQGRQVGGVRRIVGVDALARLRTKASVQGQGSHPPRHLPAASRGAAVLLSGPYELLVAAWPADQLDQRRKAVQISWKRAQCASLTRRVADAALLYVYCRLCSSCRRALRSCSRTRSTATRA